MSRISESYDAALKENVELIMKCRSLISLNARLTKDLTKVKKERDEWFTSGMFQTRRADALSKKCERYKQALLKYSDMIVLDSEDHPHDVGMVAREALEE